MPREDKEIEEERKAKTAYDLIRLRLNRLEKNIDKPAPIPARREEAKPKPPMEFVRNVVGSSAAAGSAEFHIFRNNRRKEMNRLEYIEKEAITKELDEKFERRNQERKMEEEARTAKKRLKRQRRKEKMKNAKKGRKNTESSSESSSAESDAHEEEANENKDTENKT
ncbi:PRKR-interacting protein 1 like protein [Ditylenchus destructor]|uniref:PRKR-interacting protein 1 like protein n=1 Tax=Ditylenchus destructor TaxID=166010 RepID=A0AAD4NI71_9BILA|nr:PRKR-interacting protein 1 like protein [Ditylenchus destructor]